MQPLQSTNATETPCWAAVPRALSARRMRGLVNFMVSWKWLLSLWIVAVVDVGRGAVEGGSLIGNERMQLIIREPRKLVVIKIEVEDSEGPRLV
jgi:hypothetical protein